MKFLIVLAALVAVAAAGYSWGLRPVHNGYAAPYRNADRQKAVNAVAEHVGAGTGTYKYSGVPGANGFGYHNNGYGHQDSGYGHRNNGYGHQDNGYGHQDNGYGHQDNSHYGHDNQKSHGHYEKHTVSYSKH